MLIVEENALTTQRASISVMVLWEMLIIYMGVKMSKLYRNFFVHNMFGHPLSEVLYWIVRPCGANKATNTAGWFHDLTAPRHSKKNGRG